MAANFPWILLGALVLAAAIVGAIRRERARRNQGLSKPWPLVPRLAVLSEPEQRLFQLLLQCLPEYTVLTQVQLLRVLDFERGRRTQALFNRVAQLSVDFLILDADTSVVAAIELDDALHARHERPWADARKTHALRSAGIPLLRWNARRLPDAQAIRTAVVGAAMPVRAHS
jgi:very-short-patch-repair endonuclease